MRLVDFTRRVIRRSGRIYIPTPYGYYLGMSISKSRIKDIAAYTVRNGKFRKINALIVLELIRGGHGYTVSADFIIGASVHRISVYHSAAFLHLSSGGREISVIPHVFPTSP